MVQLSDQEQQIRQSHAVLIHQIVKACQNPAEKPQLESMLEMAHQQGWHALVETVRQILAGKRDASLLNGLDEEDRVIISAALAGLQNPASLPALQQGADPTLAAPGIAHMIHAASRGDSQALQAVAFMAEQMINTSGDMRLLGGNMKRLLDGERDLDVLCKGMSTSGEKLMIDLLAELARLSEQ